MTTNATGNRAYFDWPDPGQFAREVWYSLVNHPEHPIALWHRLTLVRTAAGERDARVWAAVSDGRPANENRFVSQSVDSDAIDLTSGPFSLALGQARLADDAASGRIETAETSVSWAFEYEPDSLTFAGLADEERMREFADEFGTGVHWSTNQSVAMTGEVTVDGETTRFSDAPGHQGHTAGGSTPDGWTWLHCNDFAGGEATVEVLQTDAGFAPACLRLDGERHLLNGELDVFEAVTTESNEPGRWEFDLAAGDLSCSVSVAADPDHWQRVSYLTPDGSLRYNAHCSLAECTLTVDDGTDRARYQSETARVEWVDTAPPVPGSYPPFDG